MLPLSIAQMGLVKLILIGERSVRTVDQKKQLIGFDKEFSKGTQLSNTKTSIPTVEKV
jgi:hypothetical protein